MTCWQTWRMSCSAGCIKPRRACTYGVRLQAASRDGDAVSDSGQAAGSEYLLPEMTTEEHLAELRRRLLICLATWTAGSAVGWLVAPSWLQRFAADIGRTFVFVSPAEAFASYLKMAVAIGFALASPVVLYQAWLFILPALFPHERQTARRYLLPSLFLFVLGLIFAFFIVYPIALQFLLGFGSERIQPYISVARFLTFLISVTLPFGVVFQFPVVLMVLVQLEVVTVARLVALRRIVYFLAVVVGALLTPPDVASQVLMAIPIIVLYELTLAWLRKGAGGDGTGHAV